MNHSVLSDTGHTVLLPDLADRVRNSSVSVIKEMMYLGALESKKGKDIISLGVGIPFYPAPDHVHSHAVKSINSKPDIDKYTLLTGLPLLRQIAAEESSKATGIGVSEENILITPGSMSALFYSILALINPGDEVILISPFFSSYAEQVNLAQGKIIPVPMISDKDTGYRLNVEKIKKAITKKTKMIIINNPQNPTGALYGKDDLTQLASVLVKQSIYLITDEVYDYLVYDGLDYFNIASIRELWPKVIRCCSMSKKYGMMGWRIGYLHTDKKLLMHILKIHDANIVCAPHISQEAAISALKGPQDCIINHVRWLDEGRKTIMERLDGLSDLFFYIKPKGTYYIFPGYKLKIPSIEMAKLLLFEAGVVTVPGIGFGPEGEYHLRLSFGAPTKHIHKAFDKIEKWWKKYKKNNKVIE